MVERPEVPSFAQLLAPVIGAVPSEGTPALLSGLERAAAARYRGWAEALPTHAETLLACARREDEIADSVAGLFPIDAATQEAVDKALPEAIKIYHEVFAPHPVEDQLHLQAEAELQGAQAWVGIAAGVEDPSVKATLARCSELEEESSRAVKALLESLDR
ncbi:MAG: hypothetical protein ABFS41_00395 [Myxococcota bacterium]